MWRAEFVSLEESTRTLTVKAPTSLGQEGAARELGRYKTGDHVVLTWWGHDGYALLVRGVTKYGGAQTSREPFALVAELASNDAQHAYVSFRFRVPSSSVQALKALKPGDWVTVISRQHPSADASSVVEAKPYTNPR